MTAVQVGGFVVTTGHHGQPVVRMEGEFDEGNLGPLRRWITGLGHPESGGRVVFDLHDVTYLDSAAIGVFATAYRQGWDVTVRGANGMAKRVLEIVGLVGIFEFEP